MESKQDTPVRLCPACGGVPRLKANWHKGWHAYLECRCTHYDRVTAYAEARTLPDAVAAAVEEWNTHQA